MLVSDVMLMLRFAYCKPVAKELNMLLLDALYIYSVATFMCRIYTSSYCENLLAMFTKLPYVHIHTTRSCSYNFYLHSARKTVVKNCITHTGVVLWNSLLVVYKQINSYSLFKSTIKKWIVYKY
jgi:hypothetical protein